MAKEKPCPSAYNKTITGNVYRACFCYDGIVAPLSRSEYVFILYRTTRHEISFKIIMFWAIAFYTHTPVPVDLHIIVTDKIFDVNQVQLKV